MSAVQELPPVVDMEQAGQLTPGEVLKLVNDNFSYVTGAAGDNAELCLLAQVLTLLTHYRSLLEGVGQTIVTTKHANTNERDDALSAYQQLCQRTTNLSKTVEEMASKAQ